MGAVRGRGAIWQRLRARRVRPDVVALDDDRQRFGRIGIRLRNFDGFQSVAGNDVPEIRLVIADGNVAGLGHEDSAIVRRGLGAGLVRADITFPNMIIAVRADVNSVLKAIDDKPEN